MKKLFILIADGGDGSYYPQFTFNEDWILQQEASDLCYPALGCDGDGFHYTVLNIPDEMSLKDLGISYDCAEED